MVSDNELKARFFRFIELVEKIRCDVEARCGCSVYSELLPKSPKFKLYKRKGRPQNVFAYIAQQPTLERLKISAWEKDAEEAGVAHLACKRADKGMWGKPALIWYVKESDAESYKKAVNTLSKICQVIG